MRATEDKKRKDDPEVKRLQGIARRDRRKLLKDPLFSFSCKECGNQFREGIGEFCTNQCHRAFYQKPYWVDCAGCFFRLGLGSKTVRRVMRIHGDIDHALKRRGISRYEGFGRPGAKTVHPRWDDDADGWMDEYKPKFPDWSYIWWKAVANERSKAKWKMLTKAEREKRYAGKDKANQRRKLKEWKRKKAEIEPAWKIAQSLRSRLASIMNGGHVGSMEETTGCSLPQLRAHIASLFTKHMNWDNFGSYWQVDHVIPVSKHDHSDLNQLLQCWHWTNLAPLEKRANLAKSNHITKPQMSLRLDYHA